MGDATQRAHSVQSACSQRAVSVHERYTGCIARALQPRMPYLPDFEFCEFLAISFTCHASCLIQPY